MHSKHVKTPPDFSDELITIYRQAVNLSGRDSGSEGINVDSFVKVVQDLVCKSLQMIQIWIQELPE